MKLLPYFLNKNRNIQLKSDRDNLTTTDTAAPDISQELQHLLDIAKIDHNDEISAHGKHVEPHEFVSTENHEKISSFLTTLSQKELKLAIKMATVLHSKCENIAKHSFDTEAHSSEEISQHKQNAHKLKEAIKKIAEGIHLTLATTSFSESTPEQNERLKNFPPEIQYALSISSFIFKDLSLWSVGGSAAAALQAENGGDIQPKDIDITSVYKDRDEIIKKLEILKNDNLVFKDESGTEVGFKEEEVTLYGESLKITTFVRWPESDKFVELEIFCEKERNGIAQLGVLKNDLTTIDFSHGLNILDKKHLTEYYSLCLLYETAGDLILNDDKHDDLTIEDLLSEKEKVKWLSRLQKLLILGDEAAADYKSLMENTKHRYRHTDNQYIKNILESVEGWIKTLEIPVIEENDDQDRGLSSLNLTGLESFINGLVEEKDKLLKELRVALSSVPPHSVLEVCANANDNINIIMKRLHKEPLPPHIQTSSFFAIKLFEEIFIKNIAEIAEKIITETPPTE